MSDDLEDRVLDLEFRFANMMTSLTGNSGELNIRAEESVADTTGLLGVVLNELVTDGTLERNRLIQAIEAYSARVTMAGRQRTRQLAVEILLNDLRNAGNQTGGKAPSDLN